MKINVHSMLLISLSLSIIVLLIIRIRIITKYTEKFKKNSGIELGGSMTIGTREIQEDCYFLKESRNGVLMVLADGMGEAYGGRIASRTAVSTFSDLFESYNALDNPQYFFKKAFHSSNNEILKVLDCGGKGMASLASAIVYNNKLFYSSVGNVKIYVHRNGDLIPITTGHTLDAIAKREFCRGKITKEEAIYLLETQRVYNYLGQDEFCDLEIFDTPVTLIKNDIVVLMTDGVYDLLSYNEIEKTLNKSISCSQMAYEIIEKVNCYKQKNKDNASIILLKVGSKY